MFYMGKEFDIKTNKEYKTVKGAKEAAKKAGLKVFDEVGQILASYVSGVEQLAVEPEETAENVQDTQEGEQETPEGDKAENLPHDSVEAVQGKIQRVFAGKLRIRRAPSDDPGAACGVSLFDKKRVTEKHTVAGKVWYKTLEGYFISGDPRHTKFISDEE